MNNTPTPRRHRWMERSSPPMRRVIDYFRSKRSSSGSRNWIRKSPRSKRRRQTNRKRQSPGCCRGRWRRGGRDRRGPGKQLPHRKPSPTNPHRRHRPHRRSLTVIKDQPGAFMAKTKRGKKRQRTAYQKAQEILNEKNKTIHRGGGRQTQKSQSRIRVTLKRSHGPVWTRQNEGVSSALQRAADDDRF